MIHAIAEWYSALDEFSKGFVIVFPIMAAICAGMVWSE